MRILGGLVVALVAAGCASVQYPAVPEATADISVAAQAVDSARVAGADSLAAEVLQSAQANLVIARDSERQGKRDRAAFKARLAQADAIYARALAERVAAERRRSQEQAALGAARPGGTE
jgi:hypothetical protein